MSSNLIQVKSLNELKNVPSYSAGSLVAYFYTDWAESTDQLKQLVETLAQSFSLITFVKIDAELAADITKHFQIDSVPIFLIFHQGQLCSKHPGSNIPELTRKIQTFHATLSQQLGLVSPLSAPKEGSQLSMPLENHAQDTKTPQLSPELEQHLSSLTKRSPVMVFMKGNPSAPQCGFSNQTVSLLRRHNITFDYFDILTDNAIRQGLKIYSKWPTFPQVFVQGTLVGGLDILLEHEEDGVLDDVLSGEN